MATPAILSAAQSAAGCLSRYEREVLVGEFCPVAKMPVRDIEGAARNAALTVLVSTGLMVANGLSPTGRAAAQFVVAEWSTCAATPMTPDEMSALQ